MIPAGDDLGNVEEAEPTDDDALLAYVSADRLHGEDEAARIIGEAILATADTEAVFVYATHTLLVTHGGDRVLRFRNGQAILDALDRYRRTGELPEPGRGYVLEAPPEGSS